MTMFHISNIARILSPAKESLQTKSIFRNSSFFLLLLFIISYVIIIQTMLPGYLNMNYTTEAAIILSFYIIRPENGIAGRMKYWVLSILFLILTIMTSVKTFFFLSTGFAILFAVESLLGATGYLPFFLLCLISPTFKYFNNMFGFPVRLRLSQWAGDIIGLTGKAVEVKGNLIILDGNEFSVDPACVGLKMITISLLTGLMIMAYFNRQHKREFSFLKIVLILIILVILNVISNLIRIIILTVLNLPPESPLHDITGLLCLLVYVIVPAWFIIGGISKKEFMKKGKRESRIRAGSLWLRSVMNMVLFSAVILTGMLRMRNDTHVIEATVPLIFNTDGYKCHIAGDDVLKLEKKDVLVYIKPLSAFYGAEHNPMICWTGSGYSFSMINKMVVEGREVYTGILKKDNDLIYSAWWFDSGSHITISQAGWRLRALKGEKFYLVNVNSENENKLLNEVKSLLSKSGNQ